MILIPALEVVEDERQGVVVADTEVPITADRNVPLSAKSLRASTPLRVVECSGLHEFMVVSDEWTVAEMCGERETAWANAHLFAAAPALVAALKQLAGVAPPPVDAICHRGICSQDKCGYCQLYIRAFAALQLAEPPS